MKLDFSEFLIVENNLMGYTSFVVYTSNSYRYQIMNFPVVGAVADVDDFVDVDVDADVDGFADVDDCVDVVVVVDDDDGDVAVVVVGCYFDNDFVENC
ncbi:unnamed protein product [[Candida] boidinii]|nr:unnamed protein product [[Candida] boidinii]